MEPVHDHAPRKKGLAAVVWLSLMYLIDRLIDGVGEVVGTIRREFSLFAGTALVIIGGFGFESDKYCDGNTADYLSCTRPSTYYFFDWLDVTCLVLGAFLILFWLLKNRRQS